MLCLVWVCLVLVVGWLGLCFVVGWFWVFLVGWLWGVVLCIFGWLVLGGGSVALVVFFLWGEVVGVWLGLVS